MITKTIFVVASLVSLCAGGLLRTPKIYNALITTDENLTPSRAFPVIQPVVHTTYPLNPLYPSSFYYNSYPNFGHYGGNGRRSFQESPQQDFNSLNQQPSRSLNEESQNTSSEESVEGKSDIDQPKNGIQNQKNNQPPQNEGVQGSSSDPNEKPHGKSPVTLNQFGLPPSLVPLQGYGKNVQNSQSHQAYPYSFPIIYDSFGNFHPYQQYPVLPPLNYFRTQYQTIPAQEQEQQNPLPPQGVNYNNQPQFDSVGLSNSNSRSDQNDGSNQQTQEIANGSAQEINMQNSQIPSFPDQIPQNVLPLNDDNIKNFANKNKDIPDVPAPPLPISNINPRSG